MNLKQKLSFSCWCFVLLVHGETQARKRISIKDVFEKYMIVPQCFPTAPKEKFSITFYSTEIDFGTRVHPFTTIYPPYVTYPANPNSLYAFVIFDPDLPFLYKPYDGQLLQSLVVNIPGNFVHAGDRLAVYLPHIPFPGSNSHRCVYLAYKQPSRINITVELQIRFSTNLTNFDVYRFSRDFNLGDPVAGNFYISELPLCDKPNSTCTSNVRQYVGRKNIHNCNKW